MEEMRLFRLAPDGWMCSAFFVPREGWSVTLSLKRADEHWPEAERRVYSHLTTSELVDVIENEASRLLQRL